MTELETAIQQARSALASNPALVHVCDQMQVNIRNLFEKQGVAWTNDTVKAAALMMLVTESMTKDNRSFQLCTLALALERQT